MQKQACITVYKPSQRLYLKHRTMLALLFASGLRRIEWLNLKINDIDFEINVLTVRGGKGKKDRQTLLSESIKGIGKYIAEYKPKEYIFEGQLGGDIQRQ